MWRANWAETMANDPLAGLDPVFHARLSAAIAAAEKATGQKVSINEAKRSPETQAQYYANYVYHPIVYNGKTYTPTKKGGIAARPPGYHGAPGSRHQLR